MNKYPLISIIIPVFNRYVQLLRCIKSLQRQRYPKDKIEILVIDDGSSPALKQTLLPPGVGLIRQIHQGDTAARNLGAAYAKGDLFFFTDSDCIVLPSALRKLYETLKKNDASAARGAYLNKSYKLVARFVQLDFEYRQEMLANSREVDLLDTACTLVRRNAFLAIGGFNPVIKVCGDVAFSYALRQKGYKLVFVPEARVYHQHSDSILSYLRNKCRKGIWRARVFQLYPKKLIHDSYTPQSLKLQCLIVIILSFLTILLLILPYKKIISFFMLTFLISFLFSCLPFMIFTFRRDKVIGLLNPCFIFLRALALLSGSMFSLFSFSWDKQKYFIKNSTKK